MANRFCALPQELQIEILANLDAVSLVSCAMTCTAIYETFKNSSLLAYTLQLHLDGLKDAGTSLSHSILIESLVRRRLAWLALEVKEPLTCWTQPVCGAYELAGGAFAHMSNDHFEITWLPTTQNANAYTIRTPSIGISVAQFTMDVTQDLIVFFEDDGTPPSMIHMRTLRIHFRTISTNTVHPQAQQSPLQLTIVPKLFNTYSDVVLEIVHNDFAIHFRDGWGEIRAVVWDWTTSDLILDTSTSFDPHLPPLVYNFMLLDATYFFLTMAASCGQIQLYKLVRSHVGATQTIHLATLHLPPTAPGITILRITSHAGPMEAHPRSHIPFTLQDDDSLHMFTVEYTQESGRLRYLNVFLHRRVLLNYARAGTADAPLAIPWAEWGPPHTRVALSSPPRYVKDWRRCIYGQRAVLKQNIRATEPSGAIDVFDFSLAAVLSARGRLDTLSSSSKGHPGRLAESSVVRTGDVPLFLDDVETHLPCVISTLYLKPSCSAFMIDTRSSSVYMMYADGIVSVNADSHGKLALNIYPV